MEKLTENQQERLNNLMAVQATAGLIGSIGGVIYAKKTGGGFWRYVGYWFLGGMVLGLPAMVLTLPAKNKILKEGDVKSDKDKKGETNTATTTTTPASTKLSRTEAEAIKTMIRNTPMKSVLIGGKFISVKDTEKIQPLMDKLTAGGWKLDSFGKLEQA